MIKLRTLLTLVLMLGVNTYIFAQLEGENDVYITPNFQPGTVKTPVDMYEGVLMLVATSMIVGYYFVKNRRQVN